MLDLKGNRVTYFGHSTFSLTTSSGQVALIDPWVMTNPMCPDNLKNVPKLNVIFLSHAHSDHLGDLLALAKQHKPEIVAIFETCLWLGTKGFEEEAKPMGKGGTQKVGDFEVSVITDGALAFPVENFVSNTTTEQVKAALAAAHRGTDALSVPFSPIVVNTGSKLILIDTGLGDAAFERSKGKVGQFASNLKAAGLERSNIDAVVISHFHIDHVDGLVAELRPPDHIAHVVVVEEPVESHELEIEPSPEIEGDDRARARAVASV